MFERDARGRLPGIAAPEYRERQRRALALATDAGFEGLVAWSRGGSAQDRYADVYYLTGFYTHFPTLHDMPARWRARGHCACVIGPDATELVVDVAKLRDDDAPVADELRFSTDVVAGLGDAVRRSFPGGGRLALLGGDALAARWADWLAAELPNHAFVDADHLGHRLRLIKSPAELDLMRAAGRVGTMAVEAAMNAAQEQATEADVVTAAVEQIYRGGGVLYGLGLSSGRWAHTFSPTRPAAYDPRLTLGAGDMVRLDLYGSVDGYMFDFGRSKVVGGDANADQAAILDAVIGSVQSGLEVIRAGPTIGDVARRCDEALASSDFAARVGRSSAPLGSWGHSLGVCWEPPWIEPDNTQRLEPGMCLAVELRIEAPGRGGANYEENVIVAGDGYELLSEARPRP